MTRRHLLHTALMCLVLATGQVAAAKPPVANRAAPVPILLDTDMAGDCDDVGTAAMVNVLADRGEAKLLAVVINTSLPDSAQCASAVCTYYGRPNVPIGLSRTGLPLKSKYAGKVAAAFPHQLKDAKAIPTALDVYRKTLAGQPDHSVVIVSVGFLNNLADLLKAEPALVRKKVKRLVVMGGAFPTGREYNFSFQTMGPASKVVVEQWPTEILFSGFEIGKVVMTGARLAKATPKANPARLAYALYTGAEGRHRQSWDQTAMLAAVRGAGKYWKVVTRGRCVVQPNGDNRWQTDKDDPRHRYLAWEAERATPPEVARAIEDLMVTSPTRRGGS